MDNARIKENIIRKRTEKGISQDEMAQRLEMSRNSYRNIEKGSTYAVSRHLKEIADILNITEEELVLGYKPAEGAGSLEEVRSHYSKISDDLRQNYEERIAGLSDQLELQKLMVSDLRELIDSKNEIIRLLKNENLSLKNKLAAGNTLGDR